MPDVPVEKLIGAHATSGMNTAFGPIPVYYFDNKTEQYALYSRDGFKEGVLHENINSRRFDTKQEAEAFLENLTLNCAIYSMQLENNEQAQAIFRLTGKYEKSQIQADENNISFIVDGKKGDLLTTEKAKAVLKQRFNKSIESNGALSFEFPFCGKRVAQHCLYSLMGEKNAPNLNDAQKRSLLDYQGDHYFYLINDILWGNTDKSSFGRYGLEDMETAVKDIFNIHGSMKTLGVPLQVYRGEGKSAGQFENVAEGEEIELRGLTSSSVLEESARGFGNVIFDLKLPAGTPLHWIGLNADTGSSSAEENEVLLPPMKFKVKSVAGDKNNFKKIELERPQQLNICELVLQSLSKFKQIYINDSATVQRVEQMISHVQKKQAAAQQKSSNEANL